MSKTRIILRDYTNYECPIDVSNIEDVLLFQVLIVSGDEILIVYYKDFTFKMFKSRDDVMMSFFDNMFVFTPLDINKFNSLSTVQEHYNTFHKEIYEEN